MNDNRYNSYRHRPEVQKLREKDADVGAPVGSSTTADKRSTCCCIAMIKKSRLNELLSTYDKAFWVTKEGETLDTKCHIRRIIISDGENTLKHLQLSLIELNCMDNCYYLQLSSQILLFDIADPSSTHSGYDRGRNSTVSQSDLREMIELKPPPALPAGNVGTPTKYILKQINRCQFPVRLIAKLGLEFPRMRAKGMYGSVAFDYNKISRGGDGCALASDSNRNSPSSSGSKNSKSSEKRLQYATADLSSIPTVDQVPTLARTVKGHLITSSNVKSRDVLGCERNSDGQEHRMPENEEEELSDDGEEWDRYEALHDDVTNQERNKVRSQRSQRSQVSMELTEKELTSLLPQERLFEEGMEVVWEKGGSGLVFYTDAQHWDEAEGDFDAKTSDDWDIDMGGYYQDG